MTTLPRPIRRLLGVTLPDGRVVDITIEAGRIAAIVPTTGGEPFDESDLPLDGWLALVAPAEPHAHLDKAGSAASIDIPGGGLEGAVGAWLDFAAHMSVDDIADRARRQIRRYMLSGFTAVRSHVDILDGPEPLRGVEALIRVRDEHRDLIDVQLVALAEQKIALDSIERALDLGVDLVGGAPHRAPEPFVDLDRLIDLAERRGIGVDLHTDESLTGDPTLFHFARRVRHWPAGRLRAAGHCVRLGTLPPAERDALARATAEAAIAVIALPQTNLYLQGGDDAVAQPRGITAVRALLAAGAVVAGGGDNIRDPFNPMGRSDALETASLLVSAAQLSPEEAYRTVSISARLTMGLDGDGIAVGAPAELLVIRGGPLAQVIAEAPADRVVIHRGNLVAHTRVEASVATTRR